MCLWAYLLMGLALGGLAVWTFIDTMQKGYSILYTVGLFFVGMLCAVFVFLLGWCFANIILAWYRFASDGLYIKYPLQKGKLIPWNEFQQVCICYGGYGGNADLPLKEVLCFVKKGEKESPLHGRWKTDNPFHYRSVISIAYTPELHEGLKQKYPGDIVDWRGSVKYRP